MRGVLVLRPEPGASATVERARKLGLAARAVPLFKIEPVAWQLPDPAAFDGLLVSSANAIRHGGNKLDHLRALPVYAVGAATAETARRAGFNVAAAGDSDLAHLLDTIDPAVSLLHLAGEDRIPAINPRQQITFLTVYRSRAIENAELTGAPASIAMIHSPRAGRRLAELAERQGLDKSCITVAAISRNAAQEVGDGWASVETATTPTDEALLALAARLCNNPAPQ